MNDVGDLLAIDPSIRSPGVALFRAGKLVVAARVTFPIDATQNDAERCLAAADAIAGWANQMGARPDAIAFEWPQVYAREKSKGDPNQLIPMAGVDLALATGFTIAAAMRKSRLRVLCYKPADWIGQLPKATRGSAKSSPRAQRILSRLDAAEVAALPDQHDAIDAVGIGLHALGRLGVRRSLSAG
jgi:hypothetical protein